MKKYVSLCGILTIIMFAVGVGVLLLALGNYHMAVQQENNAHKVQQEQLLDISDNYGVEDHLSLEEFMEKEDSLEKMQNAYQLLIGNEEFEYYEMDSQFVNFIGEYQLDSKFVEGGKECINQTVEGNLLTPLKSLQIGKKTEQYLQISKKVRDGRYFKEEDYQWNKEKAIPLVMGYNYKKYLEIGSRISFYYLNDTMLTGEVIGFLEKDEKIEKGDIDINLNNQIIMPSMEVSKADIKEENESFFKILYLTKTEGKILYCNEEEYEKATDFVDKIAKETGMDYFYIRDIEIVPKEEKYDMPVNTAKILFVIANVFFIALFIGVCIFEEYIKKKVNWIADRKKELLYPIMIKVVGVAIGYLASRKLLLHFIENRSLRFCIISGENTILFVVIMITAIYAIGMLLMKALCVRSRYQKN